MLGRKKLTSSFLYFFILLVVIPVCIIFFVLKTVYQQIVVDNYIDYIVQKEANIAKHLQSEMLDASLLLASACLVNDSQLLSLATELKSARLAKQRLKIANQLKTELNYTFLHRSEIGSVVIFFDNAGGFYYKNSMETLEAEARKEAWYQQTQVHSGQVYIAGIYKGTVGNSRDRYSINVAYSPMGKTTQNKVEVVHLSYFTRALEKDRNTEKEYDRGEMLIVDGSGRIMLSDNKKMENHNIREFSYLQKAVENTGTSYRETVAGQDVLITSCDADRMGLNWKIINLSEYEQIVRETNMVSLVFFLILCITMTLFVMFAAIFLRRIFEQEQEKTRLEMEALQSQINPHFISNSLNAIRFMAIVARFEGIEKMSDSLIGILTTTFSRGKVITIREEVEIIRKYVYLMQIRYGGKFKAEYNIQAEIMEYKILKMLLQPIIENAIIHGFHGIERDCCIEIYAYQKEDNLLIEILDNGNGMPLKQLEAILSQEQEKAGSMRGIGMSNIRKRIVLLYGAEYGMMVDSKASCYTRVVLTLPIILEDEGEIRG